MGIVRKIQDQVAESGNSRIMNPEGGEDRPFLIKQTVEIIASAVRIVKDQVNKVMKMQD